MNAYFLGVADARRYFLLIPSAAFLYALRDCALVLVVSSSVVLGGILFFKSPAIAVAVSIAEPARAAVANVATSNAAEIPTTYNRAPAVVDSSTPSTQELHIADNGFTYIRGAMVVEVTGATLRISMLWGHSNFVWYVVTDTNTHFVSSNGEVSSLRTITIGDTLDVTGMVMENATTPVIYARYVRE
jgi:hypothetical protein